MSAPLRPRARITVPGQRLPSRRFQTAPTLLAGKRGAAVHTGYSRAGIYQTWSSFRDVFAYGPECLRAAWPNRVFA